jgi:hypothetical protein
MPTFSQASETKDFTFDLTLDTHYAKIKVKRSPPDSSRQASPSGVNVILNTAAGFNITGNLSIGTVTTENNGGVVAAVSTGFTAGTATGDAAALFTDAHGAVANLIPVVDSTTLDAILSTGKQVYGLVQAANGTSDGDAINVTASSENVQISFVTHDGDNTYTLVSITDTVDIGINKAYAIGNEAAYEVENGLRDIDVVEGSGISTTGSQVQFGDGGGGITGDADFTYDTGTDTLNITNLDSSGTITAASGCFEDTFNNASGIDTSFAYRRARPTGVVSTLLSYSTFCVKNLHAADNNNYIGLYIQDKPDADADRQYGAIAFAASYSQISDYYGGLYFGVSSTDDPTTMNWVYSLFQPRDTFESSETGLMMEPNRWISNSYTTGTSGQRFQGEKFGFQANINGSESCVFGNLAFSGSQAVIIGHFTAAPGASAQSVGIGYNVTCASNSVTIGRSADSSGGAQTVCIGWGAVASSTNNIAIGYQATASANVPAICIGKGSTAGGQNTTVLGTNINCTGSHSYHIGTRATSAQPNNSVIAIGQRITGTIGVGSVVIGSYNANTGNGARSDGTYTVAIGYRVTCTGNDNVVLGNFAGDGGNNNVFVVGDGATINASNQIAFGGTGTGAYFDHFWLGSGVTASANLRTAGEFVLSTSHQNATGGSGLTAVDLVLQGGRGRSGTIVSQTYSGQIILRTSVNTGHPSSINPYFDRVTVGMNGTCTFAGLVSTADGTTFDLATGGSIDLFNNDFKRPWRIEHTAATYTQFFISNGTTPNGAVTGNAGDLCFNGDSAGNVFICRGDGAGSSGTIWITLAAATAAEPERTITDTDVTISKDTDKLIFCNPATVAMLVNLPDSTTCQGQRFEIARDIAATTYGITILPGVGGQNINGATSYTLNTSYETVTLVSRGSGGWRIM